MKLTTVVRVRGEPTALLSMIQDFNRACSWLSTIAFQERIFHWLPLQRRSYYELKRRFGLNGVQATVAIRKVAYAYKAKRDALATFRLHGAIPVHRHAYRRDGTVLVYGHRLHFSARPDVTLSSKQQATLTYQDGRFFLYQIIEVPLPPPLTVQDYLGADMGIVSILVDSDGTVYAGSHLNGLRKRYARLRAKLQSKGTKSAKRLLIRRRRRESRFGRDVNHRISKRVVAKAKDTLRGIALEDLGGIRQRITVRKAQRRQHHTWSFSQLRTFLEYKASLVGLPVIAVDPSNTSRVCPQCGVADKRNRRTQSQFRCVSCGFAGHADTVAAMNIAVRGRALGNVPNAASSDSCKGV